MSDTMKKRKLVLNRETLLPLQHNDLEYVAGGASLDLKKLRDEFVQSGSASMIASGLSSLAASSAASAGVSAAAGGSASGAAASIVEASRQLNAPCYIATSIASIVYSRNQRSRN